MKIIRDKQFKAEIQQLKKLSALRKKDYTKYEHVYIANRNRIAQKYEVSIRTVQHWIKNKTPWVRQKRADVGKERVKVSRKITRMIDDGLKSGKKKKEVFKKVQEMSGQKLSGRILDREAGKEVNSDATGHGSEARDFFRKLFECDLIPPDKGNKMKYNKTVFMVNKSDLEDICRILGNAYNRYSDAKDKFKINRASYRKTKLWQLYDEAVNIINERGVSISDLKEISLFIQRLEIDRNKINPRVITFWKILQDYKPDVTLDEVISLAEEYEGVYD